MSSQVSAQKRYQAIRDVAIIGIVTNLFLTIFKIVFGILGQSQALIADGFHSLSSLISDFIVLIAALFSTQKPDARHPYGYARYETLATITIGILLLIMAIGLFIKALQSLLAPELLLHPTGVSLAAAIVSILVKEALYQHAIHTAHHVKSPVVRANAWHYRSDAYSSLVVLFGVIGSLLGFIWLDAVATIGVSLMIAYLGWKISWEGLLNLMDRGLHEQKLMKIHEMIQSVSGVHAFHQLRTRKMGPYILMDVQIEVNPQISVSEAHKIADTVRSRLIGLEFHHKHIADVLVHIDSENDLKPTQFSANLPLRQEVVARLQHHWHSLTAARAIEQMTLHYSEDKLIVDIDLSLDIVPNIEEAYILAQRFTQLVANEPLIHAINVYYRASPHYSKQVLELNELQKLA
jgi:cation diffusion facilitator family transporter